MKNKLYITMISLLFLACQSETLEVPFDCSTVTIDVQLVGEVNDVACGAADGSFELAVTGGEGPYTFTVNNNEQSTGVFSNLDAATYNVGVVDVNGCTGSISVDILNLDGVNMSLSATDAGCGTNNGTISITASGGEMPYMFSLNGGTFTQDTQFTGLPIGSYQVTAVDNHGCEVVQTASVLSGVSYNTSVADIISSNCAVSGCHAGSINPDLRTLAAIQNSSSRIKSRVVAGTMPPGGALAQSQINLIACWVDDGAPNN